MTADGVPQRRGSDVDLYGESVVWSELALLGAGAVATQTGSALQRRADRRDRREQQAAAEASGRAGMAEAQTKAALLAVVERLLELQAAQDWDDPDRLVSQVPGAVTLLRRQGLLVAHDGLRERIEAAGEALVWWRVVDDRLRWGLFVLVDTMADDLAPAIGAYLRHEPVPPAGERLTQYVMTMRAIQAEPAC